MTSVAELGGIVMSKVEQRGVASSKVESGGGVTTSGMQSLDAMSTAEPGC